MRFSGMIEVFNPKNGNPIIRVRWTWIARIITKLFSALDYAEENEGWADGR